jgi:hypothetical protein
MNQTPNDIYQKIKDLGKDVKERLKTRGIVVPSKTKEGLIRVGYYKIQKAKSGFYSILDYSNEVIVDNINLPQTAALLANKLALGKLLDDDLLRIDQRYGHALFEEELHSTLAEKSLISKNIDRAEVMYTKRNIAKYKKEQCRKAIFFGFEKLMRFR